jgi:hypothetical protein
MKPLQPCDGEHLPEDFRAFLLRHKDCDPLSCVATSRTTPSRS